MARFHVNTETGKVGRCNAGGTLNGRGCPFGGDENHAESIEEAREIYEAYMNEKTHKPLSKKPKESNKPPRVVLRDKGVAPRVVPEGHKITTFTGSTLSSNDIDYSEKEYYINGYKVVGKPKGGIVDDDKKVWLIPVEKDGQKFEMIARKGISFTGTLKDNLTPENIEIEEERKKFLEEERLKREEGIREKEKWRKPSKRLSTGLEQHHLKGRIKLTPLQSINGSAIFDTPDYNQKIDEIISSDENSESKEAKIKELRVYYIGLINDNLEYEEKQVSKIRATREKPLKNFLAKFRSPNEEDLRIQASITKKNIKNRERFNSFAKEFLEAPLATRLHGE